MNDANEYVASPRYRFARYRFAGYKFEVTGLCLIAES